MSNQTVTIRAHQYKIISIIFDENSKIVATCSEDNIMFLWRLPSFDNKLDAHPCLWSAYSIKILQTNSNSTVNIALIYKINRDIMINIPKSRLIGYDDGCFAVSIDLGIIV